VITSDGWLDWAIRLPGNPAHVNGGVNEAKGIFLHSAEGYADHLIELATDGPLSWHLSNLMDGRVFQHFPFTAQCWHATAANNKYIGMEHEGVFTVETSLNEAQIANAVRVIKDLSEWKGWTPTRPSNPAMTTHTLWEHREVTRIGGSATACPSGRIPWDVIMQALQPPSAAVIDGIGVHYDDGSEGPVWSPVDGKTLDGIGVHMTDGSVKTLWP
jgi:hypothetical protein